MNKKILKILYLIPFIFTSSCSNKVNQEEHIHNDTCEHDHEEHNHEHEHKEISSLNTLSTSKDKIYDIPEVITFASTDTSSNYGEVTIQAHYEPSGCLTDTIWESSDINKVKIEVDDSDSSIAKLICIEKFEGELTITAKSKYFNDCKYEIKVTYKDSFEIVSKSSGITLKGTNNRNCSGSSYVFTYSNTIDITSLYEVSDTSIELTYSVSNTGLTIDGTSIRMNKAINGSYTLKITPKGYEDKAISIPVTTSYTSSSGSHSYTVLVSDYVSPTCYSYGYYATYKCAYCSATTGGGYISKISHNYSYWHKLSSATCNTAETGYWECLYCTSHLDETTKGSALGHNMTLGGNSLTATCTSNGKTTPYKCTRCGITTGGEVIPALGHSWNSGVVTTEATCTSSGVKTYTCSRCSSTKTETISALGHSYGTTFTRIVSPCCHYDSTAYGAPDSSTGIQKYKCNNPNHASEHQGVSEYFDSNKGITETYKKCSTCSNIEHISYSDDE